MAIEIINERLLYPSYEIIGGEKIISPTPNLDHSDIIFKIAYTIGGYLIEHKCGYVYTDNVDVHFSDGSLYKPDLCVVLKSNEKILAGRKAIYEAYSVREYWIIDPRAKSVSVFLLRDGKYFLDDEYILFDEEDVKEAEWLRSNGEEVDIKHEIPVKILDGLTIPLEFVFSWGY